MPNMLSTNMTNQIALKPDTSLAVFSCTKLLTAIAILQLVEKGAITLDEPVAQVLLVSPPACTA